MFVIALAFRLNTGLDVGAWKRLQPELYQRISMFRVLIAHQSMLIGSITHLRNHRAEWLSGGVPFDRRSILFVAYMVAYQEAGGPMQTRKQNEERWLLALTDYEMTMILRQIGPSGSSRCNTCSRRSCTASGTSCSGRV